MAQEVEPWISPEEAAQHLGMKARTVRHLMQNGQLKASKLNTLWRTKKSWLDQSMEKNTVSLKTKTKK